MEGDERGRVELQVYPNEYADNLWFVAIASQLRLQVSVFTVYRLVLGAAAVAAFLLA